MRRAAFLLMALSVISGTALAEGAAEIKIGNTVPYSGPASAFGDVGKTEVAFFKMVNDQGGVHGHKVVMLSQDDGYIPAKSVEQARWLVEHEEVAFIFGSVGTAGGGAIEKYMNGRHVPQLFVLSGSNNFSRPETFPWTMAWPPSSSTEASIYTRTILKTTPGAKIGILYQNDDFGKDYVDGVKAVLGDKYATVAVAASYETSDATVDSQVVTLQAAGVDALIIAATPKFAAQTIRKVADLGWKPQQFLSVASDSIKGVLEPAGIDKAVGVVSAAYIKDGTDPCWQDDAGMKQWRDFMAKYMPGADLSNSYHITGYGLAYSMLKVLEQCGDDFSRENVMKQAVSLKDVEVPVLLPGVRLNTSATSYHAIDGMQLQKFDGKSWVLFGETLKD